MKKLYVCAALLIAGIPYGHATIDHLLPKVKSYTITDGTGFVLNRDMAINDETNCALLVEVLENAGGRSVDRADADVTVEIVESIPEAFNHDLDQYPHEAYTIRIEDNSIHISALTPTGVIRAAQTLNQLAINSAALENAEIVDWPAFKIRGYMHDVGRSFISVDELKKQIRLLSQFKINTFHWHFTENQAWRLEVKKYPNLTEPQYMTRLKGDYYTRQQVEEVLAEAKKYGVIVVPEIDMPGHSRAFERAMGFTMQSSDGQTVLKDVLTEVAQLFKDSPYIHIGGDETTVSGSFLSAMVNHLHSLGKKVVCWNPLSGVMISDYGFDMTQMWSTAGAKVANIPNIDCRYNYINHFDVFADLVGIYKSRIYYEERVTPEVAGTISSVWNDRKCPGEKDIVSQNNIYACILASGERAWMGGGAQYIEEGGTMLPDSGSEYEEFADWERRFLLHKDLSLSEEPIPYVKQTNVKWNVTQGFTNDGDIDKAFIPETNLDSPEIIATPATGAGIYLRHTWGGIVPGLYKDAAINQTAYAYTYVFSPSARKVGALIEFQNYSRSEKDKAPESGKWDRKGSRVWVNEAEIFPPEWGNTGKIIDNEVDLLNENFPAREPIQLDLQQGWNKVLIKLPYIALPSNEVRLNKWMYTFVFTELDGRHAVPDLVYSPTKILDADAETLLQLIPEAESPNN